MSKDNGDDQLQVQFDKQYPVYAFDTACFYTEQEVELDRKLNELRYCLKEKESLTPEKKSEITKAIGKTKEHLKSLIDDNVGLVREVRSEALKDSNVVQVFESTLVRCLGMKSEEINDAMVIVKVYYFGVAESIIKNGFNMNGKHYVFFSASAGQIRTKKFVAIREDLLSACMNTLTCGLTIDGINSQGGVNINKYLAYLALSNSATEEWTDFDIDKCIVIDDFETNVCSVVDFINEKDYSITREVHDVPITHTDGCGMISFDLSKKNFMVRAPWVKGLLSPFPFERYIKEANERDPSRNHGIVKDVYGQEHDILAEGIKIIFCKSQFKMYKYFKDWNTYKENFKKYHCSAGKCNVEPDVIKRATINYQMLQTLTTLTDDELTKICSKTNSVLSRISTDKNTMLRCMGVDEDNHYMNSLQKCLLMYPELLQDEHCKDQLREMRKSILKEARAGKLMVDGKYQFLIPDLYAACQHWFDGIEVPQGLLENGEVWTRQYQKVDKLDVLRSPHLYKEHAVRNNVWSKKPEIRQWFKTDGIYTSTFDCISKILQFDVDGDKALVVAEPTLVAAADRECEYIVPLYYPMAKAEPAQIDSTALFNGMVAAWTGGNIGVISNHITKIWQMDKPDEDAVKILCMENNFVIDYAKTLYKPTRPKEWDERLKKTDSNKLPAFFEYAKGKEPSQITARGRGVVDRIYYIICNYKFRFDKSIVGKFDPKMLMYEPLEKYGDTEESIVSYFRKKSQTICANNNTVAYSDDNKYWFSVKELRKDMQKFGSAQKITDILVHGLFIEHNVRKKSIFWDCFGDVVELNLTNNLRENRGRCLCCGKYFKVEFGANDTLCPTCRPKKAEAIRTAECSVCGEPFKTRSFLPVAICPACQMVKRSLNKCMDCGTPIRNAGGKGRPSCRCRDCQSIRNKQKTREWKIKYKKESR